MTAAPGCGRHDDEGRGRMPFGIDINPTEFIVLVVVAIVVLGPERLPEYAAKLGRAIRRLRVYAEGARTQLRDQMGPEFDDIDWQAYDPRQYDPRRIVREALLDDDGNDIFGRPSGAGATSARALEEADDLPVHDDYRPGHRYDELYTPYDIEAT